MGFQDYHPTGREYDVVQFLKRDPDSQGTIKELCMSLGTTRDVIEQAIENLQTLGCVREMGDGVYELISDPTRF